MAVDRAYDADANVVHAHPHGTLSVPDALDYYRDLLNDRTIADCFAEVIHFDRVEHFEFSSHDAREVALMLAVVREAKNVRVTVFVGKCDAHYGIARAMQTLYELEDPSYPTFIVRSDEELARVLTEMSG